MVSRSHTAAHVPLGHKVKDIQFKTYREVRLEHILRAFIALDDGDDPYWWTPDRAGLMQYALQEVGE